MHDKSVCAVQTFYRNKALHETDDKRMCIIRLRLLVRAIDTPQLQVTIEV